MDQHKDQTDLFQLLDKEAALQKTYDEYYKEYDKIITHFGNVNSKIAFYGIAPVSEHVSSNSHAVFKFDVDLNQTTLSGGIVLKAFKILGKDVTKYFWNNCYKIPIELVENESYLFSRQLANELKIIAPQKIICLGSDSWEVMQYQASELAKTKIVRIHHPAYVLRGSMSLEEYAKEIESALVA